MKLCKFRHDLLSLRRASCRVSMPRHVRFAEHVTEHKGYNCGQTE